MITINNNNGIYNIEIQDLTAYVSGDIHGNFYSLTNYLNRFNLQNVLFIVCGDCGIGFSTKENTIHELNKINKRLIKKNSYILLIRGNHDDPKYFNNLNEQIILSNIICLPDYSIINYNNKNYLCIGGAISIDRKMRIESFEMKKNSYLILNLNKEIKKLVPYYWDNEKPIFNEEKLNKIINDKNIIIHGVLTHTSPTFCFPQTKENIKYFLKIDENLENDINEERNVMDMIYNYINSKQNIPIQTWFYGHFHSTLNQKINDTQFYLLGIEVISELK